MRILLITILMSSLFGIKYYSTLNQLPISPDYKIDKLVKEFWESSGELSKLNKHTFTYKQLNIKPGKIIANDDVFYYGKFIYTDNSNEYFIENARVDIYTLFNVIYAMKPHNEDEFVLKFKDVRLLQSIGVEDSYYNTRWGLIDINKVPNKTNLLSTQIKSYNNFYGHFIKNKNIYIPLVPTLFTLVYTGLYISNSNIYKNTGDSYTAFHARQNKDKFARSALIAGITSVSIGVTLNWDYIKKIFNK